ncbi:MAG TPA: DNA polymerase III subunit epsilon, partial [Pseudomonas sp.]|nr:DNA polymerase III subunit epsilon [Pseudomonas sp.]
RYGVDNSGRDLHGALLDAEILADVWLTMTGGQTNLSLAGDGESADGGRPQPTPIRRLPADRPRTPVLRASDDEIAAHLARMAAIEKAAGATPLWTQLDG